MRVTIELTEQEQILAGENFNSELIAKMTLTRFIIETSFVDYRQKNPEEVVKKEIREDTAKIIKELQESIKVGSSFNIAISELQHTANDRLNKEYRIPYLYVLINIHEWFDVDDQGEIINNMF
jgi:hypothetical protein